MKSIQKIAVLVLLAGIPWLGVAKEFSKTVEKQYTVNADALLEISNKYGLVSMESTDGNTVEITVTITAEASSESKGQEVLESISIEFFGSSDKVSAKTVTRGKNYKNLKINYKVRFPRTNSLNVKNNYGDVVLDAVDGAAEIKVQYGAARLGELSSEKNAVTINYGRGEIVKAHFLDLRLRYTNNFEVGTARLLNLDSQYSECEIGSAGRLNTKSAYDEVEVQAVAELFADCMYAELEVGKLTKSAKVELKYGDFSVDKVEADFKSISVDAMYADVELSFEPGANFSLDARADYADLSLPSGKWSETKRTVSKSVTGSVKENPTSTVKLSLQYGDGKLEIN